MNKSDVGFNQRRGCAGQRCGDGRGRAALPWFLWALLTIGLGALESSGQELRLRYSFDEPSGNALDSSGFAPAIDGLFVGGSQRTASTPGAFSLGALDLTGGGSRYLTTPSDANKVDALSSFTFTTWLNLQGTPTVTDRLFLDAAGNLEGAVQLLFLPGSSGGLTADNFRLQLTVFDTTSPVADKVISGDINAANQWIFLAATIDTAANHGEIFLGGVDSCVVSFGGGLINQQLVQNFAPFVVGGSGESFLDATPPAYVDDVRVYSGAADLLFLDAVRLQNVPEPGIMGLLGLGGAVIALSWRRRYC